MLLERVLDFARLHAFQALAEEGGDGEQQDGEEERVAGGEAEAQSARKAAEVALADHVTPAVRRAARRVGPPACPGASIM